MIPTPASLKALMLASSFSFHRELKETGDCIEGGKKTGQKSKTQQDAFKMISLIVKYRVNQRN